MPNPKDDDVIAIADRILADPTQPEAVKTLALWSKKQATWLRQMRDKAVGA